MNEDNLKQFGKGYRSREDEKEIQKKGARNSAAARKRKKEMKQLAKELLAMPAPTNTTAKMKKMKIPENEQTNAMAALIAVLQKALDGDIKALTFLRDTAGENPADKIREMDIKERNAAAGQRIELERERVEVYRDVNTPEIEYLDDVDADIYGEDPGSDTD